ncbi:MAG: hypothetical protein WC824_13430 [Bacteroidota bacterium]|jgi:hypothetical protein
MKRTFYPGIFALLMISLFHFSASAQEQETLFGSPVEHGGFGGLVTKLTPIRGEMAVMSGGYGGWLIDHRLMLGGGGYGVVTSVRASTEAEQAYSVNNENLYVEFGYGGFVAEYILIPSKLVHVNVQALVGGGSVNYRENRYGDDDIFGDDDHSMHRGPGEVLFVAEPAVNVELNVTDWFRVSAGASYRFVSGLNSLRGLENKDLSGPSGSIALKFGAF